MAEPESNVQRLERQRKEKELQEKQMLELEKQQFSTDALVQMTGYKQEMLTILQRTVAKNTSPAEFAYFLTVCQQSGLNPINKEIWCYKDNEGNLLVFTGRDGFLAKNKQNPNYLGMKHAAVCQYDEFEIDMVEGKVTLHKISNNRGNPVGAYCYVYIEGKKDTFVYVDFAEFDLKRAKWKSAPIMMIDKVAQSFALKEAAGITGIQAAEAFVEKNGIVTAAQDISHEEINENFEEERLLQLIEKCDSKEKLEKLKKECLTPESAMAYDRKIKEFN